ncbi:MAG: hypothetical protein ACLUFN_04785 [Eubacterium sp.]
MSQNNSNDKATAFALIETINQVEGFDPVPFAVDYTDLGTGETRKRLPVMIQMAWFRLKYPEGRIAVQVSPVKDYFVATARVYPNYKDSVDCYLAEATASRGYSKEKPTVSPREWAQTAAVGIALRNAGFGLQFSMAGEDFESSPINELSMINTDVTESKITDLPVNETASDSEDEYIVAETLVRELTLEEKLEKAYQVSCPIVKYNDKTLGDVLQLDPCAIKWVATKYIGSDEIKQAAELICEYALQQATA